MVKWQGSVARKVVVEVARADAHDVIARCHSRVDIVNSL